ncbi:minor capsid protein [Streptomyces sp. TP-A0875]|uniref:minor capsid protein n=1 Tax=Streptomyces sp. TP-A0875 TaxID=552354 RepID=UPI0006B60A86|nr:minor capsid protein [Streptomyces sp. TP-A0875]
MRLTWNGDRVAASYRSAGVVGLRAAGEHVLTESRKVVPIEEGTLERSGAVSVDSARLEVAVSYDTPYAVRQHENMQYRHDSGRSAKYLEGPLTRERAQVTAILAAHMRRAR